MRFEVFDVTANQPIEEFGDAKTAQAKVKALKAKGKKVKINKKPEHGGDESWKAREQKKFETKEYTPVPWHAASWFKKHDHHFCHMSKAGDGTIAFTPDSEYGRQDRQVKIRPGKYLAEFFPKLGEAAIREWSNRCALMIDDGIAMHITQDKDEIEWVYRHGPTSCMAGGYHPVGAWATADFGVAYLKRKDGKRAMARTVVCVTQKVFIRIYGDGGAYNHALMTQLQDQGYVEITKAPKNWMRGMKMDPRKGNGSLPSMDFHHAGGDYKDGFWVFRGYP